MTETSRKRGSIDKDRLRELWNHSELIAADIAQQLGVPTTTVYYYAKQLRLPSRRGSSARQLARDDRLRALWEEGLSGAEIGARMGLTRQAVYFRAKLLGLDTKRSQTQARKDAVLDALRADAGTSLADAASRVGVNVHTVRTWQRNDAEFAAACETLACPPHLVRARRDAELLDRLLPLLEQGSPLSKAVREIGAGRGWLDSVRKRDPEARQKIAAACLAGRGADYEAQARKAAHMHALRRGKLPTGRCHNCGASIAAARSRCGSCRERRRPRDHAYRRVLAEALFPAVVRRQLLTRLAAGEHLAEVCEDLGVPIPRVHSWSAYEPAWRDKLDAALTAGRDPGLNHGTAVAYRDGRCRCPECRAAKRPPSVRLPMSTPG